MLSNLKERLTRSLQANMMIRSFLVLASSFVLFEYIVYSKTSEQILSLTESRLISSVTRYADRFDNDLKSILVDMETVSNLPALRDFYLNRQYQLESEAKQQLGDVGSFILQLYKRNTAYSGFHLYDELGRPVFVMRHGEISNEDSLYLEYRMDASPSPQDQIKYMGIKELEDQRQALHFSQTIYSEGQVLGHMHLFYSLHAITSALAKEQLFETGYMAVVSNTGQLIYHPELDNESGQSRLPEEVIGNLFSDEAAVKTIEGPSGEASLIAYSPLQNKPWQIIAYVSKDELLEGLRRIEQIIILLAIVTILVEFALIAGFVKILIIRPVNSLIKATKSILAGEYGKTVDLPNKDELGVLAQSFSEMSQSLASTINELHESQDILTSVVDNSKAIFYLKNTDGEYLLANSYYVGLIGQTKESIIGRTDSELHYAEYAKSFEAHDREVIERGKAIEREEYTFYNDQAQHWLSFRFPLFNAKNELYAVGGIATEITELKEAEHKLQRLAHYDGLTKLPNRLLFKDRATQLINNSARHESQFALLFIDLDGFKHVNDSLGHNAGDELLIEVAQRLQNSCRSTDTVSRLGGDEFTILLTDIKDRTRISVIAESYITSLSAPYVINDQEVFITPSIGIAVFPEDANSFDRLLQNADVAMYQAKNKGRNNFQFYAKPLQENVLNRISYISQLKIGLEDEDFVIHYQPKISLENNQVCGFEALIRWQKRNGEMEPPFKFIPIAEETGLIIEIGEWVLKKVCEDYRDYPKLKGLPIAINLSSQQFKHRHFFENFERIITEYEHPPELLEFEITESILMEDIEHTQEILNRFVEKGIQISIDDFGTGYSSLSYLKRFPFHTLKIDKSFVDDIPDDPDDIAITMAIVSIAHAMQIKVVAEGVENEEQLAFLRSCQCEEVQGYHFSRPLPIDELIKFLEDFA